MIVVDTGETARVAERGYFPRWSPFFRFAVREVVAPEHEIGPQLERLGITPSDIRWVVMTHLHTDHAGGLHHFPNIDSNGSSLRVVSETPRFARSSTRRVDGIAVATIVTPS